MESPKKFDPSGRRSSLVNHLSTFGTVFEASDKSTLLYSLSM